MSIVTFEGLNHVMRAITLLHIIKHALCDVTKNRVISKKTQRTKRRPVTFVILDDFALFGRKEKVNVKVSERIENILVQH